MWGIEAYNFRKTVQNWSKKCAVLYIDLFLKVCGYDNHQKIILNKYIFKWYTLYILHAYYIYVYVITLGAEKKFPDLQIWEQFLGANWI